MEGRAAKIAGQFVFILPYRIAVYDLSAPNPCQVVVSQRLDDLQYPVSHLRLDNRLPPQLPNLNHPLQIRLAVGHLDERGGEGVQPGVEVQTGQGRRVKTGVGEELIQLFVVKRPVFQ